MPSTIQTSPSQVDSAARLPSGKEVEAGDHDPPLEDVVLPVAPLGRALVDARDRAW